MDPWVRIEELVAAGRLTEAHVAEARRLVRSAAVAGLWAPRTAVARDLLERLSCGERPDHALAEIEERVAVEHIRMLIARGRGDDGRPFLSAVA